MAGSIRITNVNGISTVVDINTTGTPTELAAFSDLACTQSVALPATITADTTFYVVQTGAVMLSVTVDSTELAGPAEVFLSDAGPVTFSLDTDPNNDKSGTLLGLVSTHSGGSVAGGDFATWHRATTVDATSGSFDYDADLTGSSGTSIAVDDSTDWVTNFGWPVPKVTVAGLYTVVCRVAKAASASQLQLAFYNASGVPTGPFMPALGGNQLAEISPDTSGQAVVSWAGYLPAGTHISVDTVQPSDPGALNLAIQRGA